MVQKGSTLHQKDHIRINCEFTLAPGLSVNNLTFTPSVRLELELPIASDLSVYPCPYPVTHYKLTQQIYHYLLPKPHVSVVCWPLTTFHMIPHFLYLE